MTDAPIQASRPFDWLLEAPEFRREPAPFCLRRDTNLSDEETRQKLIDRAREVNQRWLKAA